MIYANNTNRKRTKGFTLVEILATLALIALVIPVVMKGISIATAVASDGVNKSEAVALAQAQLEEILIDKDWQSSNLSGDFGPEYPGYSWQMNSFDWTEPGLKQVDIEVLWEARGYERMIKLSTLVFNEN